MIWESRIIFVYSMFVSHCILSWRDIFTTYSNVSQTLASFEPWPSVYVYPTAYLNSITRLNYYHNHTKNANVSKQISLCIWERESMGYSRYLCYLIITLFLVRCESKISPEACPAGSFADLGADKCTPCPRGSYCPTNATTCPKPCARGYYSNTTGAKECTACEAGFKCSNSSLTPVECEDGRYSLGATSECTICPAGSRYVFT